MIATLPQIPTIAYYLDSDNVFEWGEVLDWYEDNVYKLNGRFLESYLLLDLLYMRWTMSGDDWLYEADLRIISPLHIAWWNDGNGDHS